MLSKVLGGVTVVLVLLVGFLFNQNGNLKEELGVNKQALAQCASANKTNVSNFDDVNDRLTACVDQTAVDETANEVTIANLEASYARLEIRKDRIQIKREKIFRDPDCAELRDLDMHAICPAWADELRDRATTLGRNPDTGR